MFKLVGGAVGAIAGLAAGGIWWAILPILGIGLGHLLDGQVGFTDPDDPALHEAMASREEIDRAARATFARSLAGLFVQLAQVDGELTRDEARAIRSFFEDSLGLDARELEGVREALQAARAARFPLAHVLAAAREELNPSERSLLLYALAQVAAADRAVGPLERSMLEEIAEGLDLEPGVAAAMFIAALDPHHRPEPARAPPPPRVEPEPEPDDEAEPLPAEVEADPYAALGLTAAASDDEVKRAYRALALKLHPDKVTHLGPQAVELASRAFGEVSRAYETIRSARRL